MTAPRASVPIRWYEPAAGHRASARPTLLWLHGGGFVRGGLDQPEAHDVARALAARGLTVATADYRLAPPPGLGRLRPRAVEARPGSTSAARPRGRFPLPLEDVLAAYREVSAASPGGVVLGGASAGACLAAAAVLRVLDDGRAPAGAVFAYGFFHSAHPRPRARRERSRRHRRITHATWALDVMNRNYAGSTAALADRFAFPGGHELTGFPRTLVVNAEHDNMRASGDLFAAELGAAGIDLEHHVLPGTAHAFLNRPGLRAFADAVALIDRWSRVDDGAGRGRVPRPDGY